VKTIKHFLRSIGNRVVPPGSSLSRVPYPVSLRRKDPRPECVPPGGGPEAFDQKAAEEINQARMAHLASLGLPLAGKNVLDVGCGVGHLAAHLTTLGCAVVCLDARPQNIASLRARYPHLKAHVADVEREPLAPFGQFEIVFAYGLLYHLESPLAALRNMESVCKELLLLETMVCDLRLPALRLEDESPVFSQALAGLGCRPSPSYVVAALNRIGFAHVYAPQAPPEHPDFRFTWKNNFDSWRDGRPLRCIFVASRAALRNSNLRALLED